MGGIARCYKTSINSASCIFLYGHTRSGPCEDASKYRRNQGASVYLHVYAGMRFPRHLHVQRRLYANHFEKPIFMF